MFDLFAAIFGTNLGTRVAPVFPDFNMISIPIALTVPMDLTMVPYLIEPAVIVNTHPFE
jgi:hypothetical protein